MPKMVKICPTGPPWQRGEIRSKVYFFWFLIYWLMMVSGCASDENIIAPLSSGNPTLEVGTWETVKGVKLRELFICIMFKVIACSICFV